MDWSLLGCGRSGHVTYAPDEPGVRAQLSATTATTATTATATTATTATGEAWLCLRCASYVPGPAEASGPARDAPRVRRGLQIRSLLILRIFSVERFLRALLFLGLAVLLWQFKHSQHSIEAAFDRERPILRELFRQLGFNIDHSKLVGLIQHALALSATSLTLVAIGLAAYAAIEVVEGVGLWLARRWGEYFAMVATSLGLPVEIYDLTRKVTVTALIFLAVNLALVVYLVATKRLFGVRGGKRAYESRLRSDSVMEQAIAAASPDIVSPDAASPPARPGVTPPTAASGPPAATSPGASPAPGAPTSTQEAAAMSAPTDPDGTAGTGTAHSDGMDGTGGADATGTESAADPRSAEPVGRHRATPATSAPPAPGPHP
ncbi:MAG: DUF2127 domain-containing protein [Streptosporangiaceae bacterium]